jgi:hypothetical protein
MDDGSKGQPRMTVGVDLGDRYSYLCFLDTQSGEVIEEGRLRTTPEASEEREEHTPRYLQCMQGLFTQPRRKKRVILRSSQYQATPLRPAPLRLGWSPRRELAGLEHH